MNLRFLFILAITQFMAESAQLKEFSLDNLMPGGKTYARFVPKNIKQLQFLGENYIYQKGDSIMIVKPGKGSCYRKGYKPVYCGKRAETCRIDAQNISVGRRKRKRNIVFT